MKKGMDVSTWQKKIDYSLAKKEIDFVIPRTGYALTTDNTFRMNISNAIQFGVEIPAVYHFSYALTVQDAVHEADYAISECNVTGLPKSTIIFYDFEYDSMDYAKRKGVKITREMVNEFTKAFCNRCIEKGYPTGIYLNNDYYKNIYFASTLNDSRYLIWLADWTGGPDHPCYIQQYTSKGVVPGVKGNVDMNYIFDTVGNSKDIKTVAQEVIAGKWGNGPERKINLENAGYNYTEVQNAVNQILNAGADEKDTKPTNGDSLTLQHNESKVGVYIALEDIYLRKGAGDNKFAIVKVPKGTPMYCYGFYDICNDEPWLYIQCTPFENGIVYAGFVGQDHTMLSSRKLQSL